MYCNILALVGLFFHFPSYITQALKGLILERMGKLDEALSVCINAKELLFTNASVLIDDLTLSTLQIVFQRLDHCQYMFYCFI